MTSRAILELSELVDSPLNDEEFRELLRDRADMERIVAKQEVLISSLYKVGDDHERRIRLLERVVGYGGAAVSTGLFFLKAFKFI